MAWEPKDPWGGSGQDPLDEALRKAQDSIKNLVPGRGFKSIIYIVIAVLAGLLQLLDVWSRRLYCGTRRTRLGQAIRGYRPGG